MISGIKCDKCKFSDPTVKYEDYDKWLNKPCPDCGENLLTQEDYNFCKQMKGLSDVAAQIPGMENLMSGLEKQMSGLLGADEEGNVPFDNIKNMFGNMFADIFPQEESEATEVEESKVPQLSEDEFCKSCGVAIGYCDCAVSGQLNKHVVDTQKSHKKTRRRKK